MSIIPLSPVSYTHLDVYKRQLILCLKQNDGEVHMVHIKNRFKDIIRNNNYIWKRKSKDRLM